MLQWIPKKLGWGTTQSFQTLALDLLRVDRKCCLVAAPVLEPKADSAVCCNWRASAPTARINVDCALIFFECNCQMQTFHIGHKTNTMGSKACARVLQEDCVRLRGGYPLTGTRETNAAQEPCNARQNTKLAREWSKDVAKASRLAAATPLPTPQLIKRPANALARDAVALTQLLRGMRLCTKQTRRSMPSPQAGEGITQGPCLGRREDWGN